MIDRIDDISIQKKLVGTFAIVFFIGVLTLGLNVTNLLQVQAGVNGVGDRAEELLYLQGIEIAFRELENVERVYVMTADPDDPEELVTYYHDATDELKDTLQTVRDWATDDDIVQLVDQLENERLAQLALFDEIVATLPNDPEGAMELSYNAILDKINNIYDPLEAVVEDEKLPVIYDDFDRSAALLQAAINIAVGTIVLFVAVGLVIAVVIFVVSRRIVGPVVTMADAARSIESEEFKIEPLQQIVLRQDEIGQLARVIEKMANEVKARVEQLRQQVTELQIVIDRGKMEKQVSEITDSEYFQSLQSKVKSMRRGTDTPKTNAD